MTDLLMKRTATFSDDGKLRWSLEREWDSSKGKVCWIGHNPSVADTERDDPTVKAWIDFTRNWGFGGFVAMNLYPFVSSDPAACREWAAWDKRQDWYVRDRLTQNLDIIVETAKASQLVVACWGAIALDDQWVDHVVESITTGEAPWPTVHCIGVSGSGAPKHPMARGKHRVSRQQTPIVWKAA